MDVDKRLRINTGYIISFIVIFLPLIIWLVGTDLPELTTAEAVFLALEKTGAFIGMSMFAWSLILSGRYRFIDSLFNGLDKVYVAHRFFGTASIPLLLLHPLGDTLAYVYNEGAGDIIAHFLGFKSIALTLGRLSLYGLIAIGIWSIFAKAKHETFIKIHRLLGVLFALGVTHAFFMGTGTAIQNNAVLFWYLLILSLVAIMTFIHYSLLADFLHPHFNYRVNSVKKHPGDVWEVNLKPRQRIINFKPGQFVYLSFDTLKEHGYHPFSIASSPRASNLQLYIKELGDLTNNMDRLNPGDTVKVKGPYGGFTFDDKEYEKQLWVAAGIGITPFLSKVRSLEYTRRYPEIELVYAVKKEQEAIAKQELLDVEQLTSAFNCTILDEETFGMQSLQKIAEHFGDIDERAIYLCGPPGMLKAYEDQAKEMELEDQLYFEEFDI